MVLISDASLFLYYLIGTLDRYCVPTTNNTKKQIDAMVLISVGHDTHTHTLVIFNVITPYMELGACIEPPTATDISRMLTLITTTDTYF